jgi:hypothetical protein
VAGGKELEMRELRIALAVVLVLLVVCVAAAGGILVYRPELLRPQTSSVAVAEGPVISIDSPSHGDRVFVGQAVQVFATGHDSDKIERMQLWVDGQMVISQASALPGGTSPFPLLAAWVPDTLGNHTIVVRGYDMSGVPGQASLTVFADEEPETATGISVEGCAGTALIAHQVREDETLEGIAAEYQVAAEDILACNPALDPEAPLMPGETVMVPYLSSPEEEESSSGQELPGVEPPPDIEEGPGEELPPPEEEPRPGEDPPPDVEEVASGPLDVGLPVSEPEPVVLQVEAESMETDQPYDAGYCLVRLGDAEMEWVPDEGDLFLPADGATWWDIAAELGGVDNSRTVPVYGDTLHFEIHCYAFADLEGAEPVSLGEITRDHSELDWTGQRMEATSEGGDEGGSFTLSYRICPVTCYPERELPAPYGLRLADLGGEPYLLWQWDGDPAVADGWILYRNGTVVGSLPGAQGASAPLRESDLNPPCGEAHRFQVSAYRGPWGHAIESPLSDPLELPLGGRQLCARRVTLTLQYLSTHCLLADCPEPEPDCSNCRVAFWYGGIYANGERIENPPPVVSDGSVTWSGPVLESWSCTDSAECRRVQYWARDLFLDRDTLVVDLAESEDLTISIWLADWDTDGSSMPICESSYVWSTDDLEAWENLEDPPPLAQWCEGLGPESKVAWLGYEMQVETLGP